MLKQLKVEALLSKYYLPFYVALFAIALIGLANFAIVDSIWRYSFDDGTYSHAPLILVISIVLLFSCVNSKSLLYRQKISWPMVLLLLCSSYLFFISASAQISLAYWLSFLLLNICTLSLIFRVNINLLFPICYLIFLLPIWAIFTPHLQKLSIDAVTFMMSFTGIPVYVEQQFIHIPSGVFEIAGGCSGLRYLLVSLAISSLYVYLHIKSSLNAMFLISFAILGALITNWLRISILIIIGHQTEMTSSLMNDHNNFGWFLYIPFMLVMFFLAGKLSHTEENSPVTASLKKPLPSKPALTNTLLVIIIISLSSTTLNSWQQSTKTATPTELSSAVQPIIPLFSDIEEVSVSGKGNYLVYSFDGNSLDAKPTFYENQLIPEDWRALDENIVGTWQVHSLAHQQHRAVLFTQYVIDDQQSANVGKFKLNRLKKAALGIKQTQLHWLFIPCEANCDELYQSIPQF